MQRTATRFLAVAGSLLISASVLQAQDMGTTSGRPVKIGGALGASIPLGDFGEGADIGWHIGGLVEYTRPTLPVGLRGEVTYHRFGLSDEFDLGEEVPFEVDGDASILSFIANVIVPFGMAESTARPYAIAGLGLYRLKVSAEAFGVDFSNTESKFGLNIGGGFNFMLAGFETFAEARFHSVFTEDSNTNFIPISFGFKF